MAKIRVDFSDVQSFETVPEGEYSIVVTQVEMRESQNSEHPYLNWRLEITEGEHEGRTLYFITSLSPKALWRLKEVLENLGVYEDELDFEVDEDSNLVLSPELVGLPAIAPTKIEVYQGVERTRVDVLLPADGGAPTAKASKPAAKQSSPSGGARRRSFK